MWKGRQKETQSKAASTNTSTCRGQKDEKPTQEKRENGYSLWCWEINSIVSRLALPMAQCLHKCQVCKCLYIYYTYTTQLNETCCASCNQAQPANNGAAWYTGLPLCHNDTAMSGDSARIALDFDLSS